MHIRTQMAPKSTAITITAAAMGLVSHIQESPAKPPIFFDGGTPQYTMQLLQADTTGIGVSDQQLESTGCHAFLDTIRFAHDLKVGQN